MWVSLSKPTQESFDIYSKFVAEILSIPRNAQSTRDWEKQSGWDRHNRPSTVLADFQASLATTVQHFLCFLHNTCRVSSRPLRHQAIQHSRIPRHVCRNVCQDNVLPDVQCVCHVGQFGDILDPVAKAQVSRMARGVACLVYTIVPVLQVSATQCWKNFANLPWQWLPLLDYCHCYGILVWLLKVRVFTSYSMLS